MEFAVSVRPGPLADAVDLVVHAPAGTTSAQLRRHVDAALGRSSLGWRCEGRAVPDQTQVGTSPLLHGAQLELVCREPAPDPAPPAVRPARAVVDVVVTSGPECGMRVPLPWGELVVGRTGTVGVGLRDLHVSRDHLRLTTSTGGVHVHDLGSTNGTTVDGIRVGDQGTTLTAGQTLALGNSRLTLASPLAPPRAATPDGHGRLVPGPPDLREVDVAACRLREPTRAQPPTAPTLPWVAMLVPLPIAVVAAWLFGPHFLLLALLSPVTAGATWAHSRHRHRRRLREGQQEHEAALAEVRAHAERALTHERIALETNHPHAGAVLDAALTRDARLWRRGPASARFLDVRLGLGDVDSSAVVMESSHGPQRPLLTQAPVVANLRDAVVIVGPVEVRDAVLRLVVGQLSTWHDPADLQVVLMPTPHRARRRERAGRREQEWVQWLPHTQPGVGAGSAPTDAAVTWLEQERSRRERACAAAGVQPHEPVPATAGPVLIVLAPDVTPDDPRWLILRELLERGPALGLVVCLTGEDRPAQTGSATVLEVSQDASGTVSRPGAAPQTLICDGVNVAWSHRLARALASLNSRRSDAVTARRPPSFWQLHALASPTDDARRQRAADTIAARWRTALGGAAVPPPVPVVGHTSGDPWRIDLVQEGPHVLVGGTTGSGKSEFLRCLVLGLAFDLPPTALTLVLVDFKGGAAFGDCARLPHCVGLLTDLDDGLAQRFLISLRAELHRREGLLAAAQAADIEGYWARRGSVADLPRLVVVVDEFKALAQEHPDVLAGIVRAAAVGRSLGVHLVLATQRPTGVLTPDIQANVNLRIALRVRDAADSEQVIGSRAAAGIDPRTPGAGLARHGSGALTEFVAAHVSAQVALEDQAIRVHPLSDHSQADTSPAEPRRGQSVEGAAVDLLRRASELIGGPAPRRPWLPPLPSLLPADSPLLTGTLPTDFDCADSDAVDTDCADSDAAAETRCGAPAPGVLGLIDIPENQQQSHLTWSPAVAAWRVLGGPGSGRTTALLTLVRALTALLSPTDLHVYAVDGGRGLAPLTALPTVGAVIDGDDLARLQLLAARLQGACSSPSGARTTLLLIDEWDRLVRPGAPARDLVEKLATVALDGRSSGLRLVAAGGTLLAGHRLWRESEGIALGGLAPADALLLGLRPIALPADGIPGRGVLLRDCAHVQLTAPPSWPTPSPERTGPAAPRPSQWAQPIRGLPDHLDVSSLPATTVGALRVGVGHDGPIMWEPDSWGRQLLVVGPGRSGRTTALRTLTAEAEAAGRPVLVLRTRSWPGPGRHFTPHEVADLQAALQRHPDALLVVDDADALPPGPLTETVLQAVSAADSGPLSVAVSARQHTLNTAFRGVVPALAQRQCALVLSPTSRHDADTLGVRLDPPLITAPGRGVLVVRGHTEEIQVATSGDLTVSRHQLPRLSAEGGPGLRVGSRDS